jgi:hypothetical protein
MPKHITIVVILLALVVCPRLACATHNFPPETRNAALRYWMAFAEMQDPPADKEIAELLEKTAAGETAWDEQKLGPILDKNDVAIELMQRATELPDCDWGIEYDRGAAASIAYVPRARVLARLNTLYGMRLAAKGDHQAAVDAWLAGVRFSQDLAKGGTLVFTLIAKTALLSNLNALTQAAHRGSISAPDEARVAAAVRALPEAGFDWSSALTLEQYGIEISVKKMKVSADPAGYYQELLGRAAPVNPGTLSSADAAAFANLMASAEQAMRHNPVKTSAQLPALQEAMSTLNPIYREMAPSFSKINESRMQVATTREKLLLLLGGK